MDAIRDFLFGPEPVVWLQGALGAWHPLPGRALSLLGDTWGVVLVAGIAFWCFGRRALYAVLVVTVLAAALQFSAATALQVERPPAEEVRQFRQLPTGSFPSGHVMQAVATWGVLSGVGGLPLWVPLGVGVLVSLGRVYLGMHYVGDVLAGILFGALLAWAASWAWPRAWRWLRGRDPGAYRWLALLALAGGLAWLWTLHGNPRRYEVVGLVLGAALALPLQHRRVRYEPPSSRGARAAAVLLGTGGIVALLLLDRALAVDATLPGTLTAGAAVLWALLAVPAAIRRMHRGEAR